MYQKDQLRKYQVKQPDGSWMEVEIGQLEKGDVFRQLDDTGQVLRMNNAEGTCLEGVVVDPPSFTFEKFEENTSE